MNIKVYALLSDNGDGGYTVRLFPTFEEMEASQKNIADARNRKFDPEDEYEYGYRSFENPVTIEVDETGKLVKPIYIGFGQ